MVHKSSPEHEHAKMFAPLFIGVAVALAIFGSVPVFLNSKIPVTNAMSPEISYEECIKMRDSIEVVKYPPTCIRPNGKQYEKKLPKVMMPSSTNPIN